MGLFTFYNSALIEVAVAVVAIVVASTINFINNSSFKEVLLKKGGGMSTLYRNSVIPFSLFQLFTLLFSVFALDCSVLSYS